MSEALTGWSPSEWTPTRTALLVDHYRAGLSAAESAALIGAFSKNAVISKRRRLGLLGAGIERCSAAHQRVRALPIEQCTPPAPTGARYEERIAVGRGRGGDAAAEAWAERRFRLARTVAVIEAKVRLADRNDRAVRMLREVAGNARSIGAMFDGGGSQAACKRALVTALDVCVTHFSLH